MGKANFGVVGASGLLRWCARAAEGLSEQPPSLLPVLSRMHVAPCCCRLQKNMRIGFGACDKVLSGVSGAGGCPQEGCSNDAASKESKKAEGHGGHRGHQQHWRWMCNNMVATGRMCSMCMLS